MSFPKYIVVEDGGIECPIIFTNFLGHKEIGKDKRIISAGFCDIGIKYSSDGVPDGLEVACWGESISLETKSRPVEDAWLIRRMILRLDN